VTGRGFSLFECLLALALSLFVIIACFQFFGLAQKAFFKLKEREEAGQGALAALDKVRIDLLHAGRGLAEEMALGLVEAARATDGELRTTSREVSLTLAGEAKAGATRLLLASTADIATGQDICFCDGAAGEVRTVVAVERGAVVLGRPLERDYPGETASVSLLEHVAYYLDAPARTLRRQVNATSAQPLLENAALPTWLFDPEAGLVRVRLVLEGGSAYEATVFLKNAALAAAR
jgi:hypothetical protein